MKSVKKIILVAFFFGSSAVALAQAQFSIGLKGGLNFTNLDVTSISNTYDNRTGYHLGAFTLIKFANIGIQPELIFSQQGSKIAYQGTTLASNFSYLNIPIVFKLYTVAGINLQAGPQFGFLMNNPTVVDHNGVAVQNAVKSSDLSLALGVGWDLPFGLTLDGRYNLGLKDVSNDASYNLKNQVFQISVGYKLIKLGGK